MRCLYAVALLLMCFGQLTLSQVTWRVCFKGSLCDPNACDFFNIQGALNASSNGDTIEVYEGNYDGAYYGTSNGTQLPKALTITGVCSECPPSGTTNNNNNVKPTRGGKSMRKPKLAAAAAGNHRNPQPGRHQARAEAASGASSPVRAFLETDELKGAHVGVGPAREYRRRPASLLAGKGKPKPKPSKKPTPQPKSKTSCDIFISKNGYNVNSQSAESYGFLAGLFLGVEASGTTVSNLKFLCSGQPNATTPTGLGLGVYLLNTVSVTISKNEFIGCLKGVVLDGASYTKVSHNSFESQAYDDSRLSTNSSDSFLDRWSSCNMVMITEKALLPIPAATQTSYNVIERNQGTVTAGPNSGCSAFLLTTPGTAFGLDAVQYNFVRRNQVVGIGAGSQDRILVGAGEVNISALSDQTLVGFASAGSVQNTFIERNQFASLTYGVFLNDTAFADAAFDRPELTLNIGQNIRANQFIQLVGSAGIWLGDMGHSVTENELSVVKTNGIGILIVGWGQDYIVENKITVPNTAAACEITDMGEINSYIVDSGTVC